MGGARLSLNLAGRIIYPDHPEYDLQRRVFNGAIDKRPCAIVQCSSVSDILRSLEAVISQSIPFTVRGGGHSVAGYSTIDNGVIIDLSRMRSVFVDPFGMRAYVEPGATWFDFDRETQVFGLGATGGIISNTGIAGLTLGGGLGWLMGKYGLACDNLKRVHVLLADGRLVEAGEYVNQDLLWALKGGGGNFGIVVRFEYQLHPVGKILAGSFFFEASNAVQVLRKYRDLAEAAPDDVTFDFVLGTNKKGEKYAAIDGCWCGPIEQGNDYWSTQIAALGSLKHNICLRAYCEWQCYLDDELRRGRRSYWKGLYLSELTDDIIAVIFERFTECPSRYTMLTFDHLHGAVRRVGNEQTAFSYRHHTHLFLINTNWNHPEEDEKNIEWTNALYADLASRQQDTEGYINYLSVEGRQRVKKSFSSENFSRLIEAKRKYDPKNHFNRNQNINP